MTGTAALVVIAGAWVAFNRESQNKDILHRTEPMSLSISSPVFESGGMIPAKYTCDGSRGLNPPLSLSGVPEGTISLALLADDPDIPDVFKKERGIDSFDHWTLFNIPPETVEIPEGGAVGTAGGNSAGMNAYTGPCPPPQYEPSEHRYFFRLYALGTMLELPEGATKRQVLDAMAEHVLAEAELMGRYRRIAQ